MPNPLELQFDPITATWTYIRWLGDRKQIEAQTMTWDKAVVDRSAELSNWVHGRGVQPAVRVAACSDSLPAGCRRNQDRRGFIMTPPSYSNMEKPQTTICLLM
jgi:hypothetical protein